jgi:hypothetical protein
MEETMTTIPLDDKTVAALSKEKELVAMTDAAGVVIGFFAPIGIEHAPQYAAAGAHFYPDKDKPRNGPWYTTEEVISHLKSLEKK